MSVKQLCTLHQVEAVCQCLYHLEPMCDECKYNDRHKDCPKDTLKVEDKIPESGKELYNKCRYIYNTALKIRGTDSSHDKTVKELTGILSHIFQEFKLKADHLLEDVANCIDETNSSCKQKSTKTQNNVQRMLTDVGTLMKEFVGGKVDLSRLEQRSKHFQNILDGKNMNTRNCDLKSLLTEKLACLLHSERVLTLPQAVLSSKLIDCVYPPVSNPRLELEQELDTKPLSSSDKLKEPLITGCAILRTGSIVLVDKANCSLKLFKDNGITLEIELDKEPFDVTEKDGDLCVSFPNACIIHLIEDPENSGEKKAIINTKSKCYGVEYGGGKLVVACYAFELLWFGSKWLFHVYENNRLRQVVEKDKLGRPFKLSDGHFDFCPFRDEILFLTDDGTAARFNLTGPSLLESLGDMGSRNGETLTAIRSSGNMKVTCHTENYFRIPYTSISSMNKSTLRLHGSSLFTPCEITFPRNCAGSVYFDLRSRKLVVCEKDKSDICYVYSI